MKKLMFVMMAAAALSLSACKPSQQTEITETSTDAATGTTVETTTKSDIKSDGTGTVDQKTTVDPAGAMNKDTVDETHKEVH